MQPFPAAADAPAWKHRPSHQGRPWLEAEVALLEPKLILPIGKLAISQFLPVNKLVDVIGDCHADIRWQGHQFDIVPLPHPSGASTWHRMAPGKALTEQALSVLATHPAIHELRLIKEADRSQASRA